MAVPKQKRSPSDGVVVRKALLQHMIGHHGIFNDRQGGWTPKSLHTQESKWRRIKVMLFNSTTEAQIDKLCATMREAFGERLIEQSVVDGDFIIRLKL